MRDELKEFYNLESVSETMKKIESDVVTEEETGHILMYTILANPHRLNELMDRLSKNNLNWIEVFKNFDNPHFNVESKDHFLLLFKIWTKISRENTFPFNLVFLDWGNKKAQSNFVNYILELRIDVSSNLFLNKMIKKELVTEHFCYLNAVELFKCIAQLNNKNYVLKIKAECPEMCLLGLSHILPKFNDIFDDLFYDAIEHNSFILENLFLNRKILNKLELLDNDTALRLILEHRLLEFILSQCNEFSFEILVLCVKRETINASVFLAYKAKQENFMASLLLFLLKKEVEISFLFANAIDSLSATFKAEAHTNYLKFKTRVENSYIFNSTKNSVDNFRDIRKLKKMKNGGILQRNFLAKMCNFIIECYEPKFKNLIEEMLNESIFCVNQKPIAERLLRTPAAAFKESLSTIFASPFTSASFGSNFNGVEEKSKNLNKLPKNCFAEKLRSTTMETYEKIFESRNEPFDDELMMRYILLSRMGHPAKVTDFISLFPSFEFFFLSRTFKKIQNHFDCQDCVHPRFFTNLGVLVGNLTLKRNKIFSLAFFDTRKFIENVRKNRRYFMLNFVIAMLVDGKSVVFQMSNPWLSRVIQDLVNVHATDIAPSVDKHKPGSDVSAILDTLSLEGMDEMLIIDLSVLIRTYEFVGTPQIIKDTEYLAKYVLPNSKYDEIVAMAMDLSIREVSKAMVGRTMGLVEKTVCETRTLFNVKGMEHLYLNLSLNLLHINVHEPLRVCIKSNLNNFFKITNLDINKISANQIIDNNIEIAKEVIKREIFTRIKSTQIADGDIGVNLEILNKGRFYDRIEIKEVNEKDIDEIKKKLRSISKDIPNTKFGLIINEWKNLIGVIESLNDTSKNEKMGKISDRSLMDANTNKVDTKPEATFSALRNLKLGLAKSVSGILSLIRKDEFYDEMAENLCKEILGYLFRVNSRYLYLLLGEIFKISFSAYLEVKGFLIYSKDERLSEEIVAELLRHALVPCIEYDQHLVNDCFKAEESNSAEICAALGLIRRVVLGPIKICTIYDFLYTLEFVSKIQSIKFIDQMIVDMKRFVCPEYVNTTFDEIVRIHKYSACPENFVAAKYNFDVAFVFSSISKSWDYFLRFHRVPTDYKYVKIDTLVEIVDDPLLFLSIFSEILVYALESENVLFLKFVNRAIFKFFARFKEMRHEFVHCIRPSVVPQLLPTFFYLSDGGVAFCVEILRALNLHAGILDRVIDHFKKEAPTHFYAYAFLCSPRFPELKNLFMDGPAMDASSLAKEAGVDASSPYFKIRRRLASAKSAWDMRSYKGYVTAVVDSLANECYDELKILVKNNFKSKELRNCVESRAACENAPRCIVAASELLRK